MEKKEGDEHRSASDLNFGEGLQSCFVFYVDSDSIFGENLGKRRYAQIWEASEPVFEYQNGSIGVNTIREYYSGATA